MGAKPERLAASCRSPWGGARVKEPPPALPRGDGRAAAAGAAWHHVQDAQSFADDAFVGVRQIFLRKTHKYCYCLVMNP